MINYGMLTVGLALLIVGAFALRDTAQGYMRFRRGSRKVRFVDAFRNPERVRGIYFFLCALFLILGIFLTIEAFI